MADLTGISWADSTFNPWIGCEKVSPGCLGAHCYAETLVTGRMGRAGTWGADGVRQRTSDGLWKRPIKWEREADAWHAEHGRRRRVFCASLADVFEPRPELIPWRSELFALIRETPSLDWLILTKRPDEARDYIDRLYGATFPDVYPHVWLGTSIENARHTYRADVLRECRVALRFLSCEPLLGSLFPWPPLRVEPDPDALVVSARLDEAAAATFDERRAHPDRANLNLDGIGWVIVGGESGGREARPMHADWAREIREAVLDAGTVRRDWPSEGLRVVNDAARPALHIKQWGSHDEDGAYRGPAPTSGGKRLDGVDWCEIPDYVPPTTRLFA